MKPKITSEEKQKLQEILRALASNPNAGPFNQPVDAVALGIPDYPQIVKTPMDLSTVSWGLEDYSSVSDCYEDTELIWSNCLLYNGQTAPISQMALRLRKLSQGLFKKHLDFDIKKSQRKHENFQ